MNFAEALKNMMAAYDRSRAMWVDRFGTEDGFDEWFTCKADRNATKADELLTAKVLSR